ncbi:MATH domain-containing protein [Chloropicon primus]|uniref:MATH domain-containing protein n=1 Tax=Chloropicon primus TaxID=1764295 RepID=A0A5B8MCC6_9CHLO|nr:hypothetical protein A3770_01p05270 [Chloropicon primus]UPQ97224.1 MATH domain-containing protein [Chloropicon primus]|eukprot:QDZ18009.1 hypothetical protein A3770_01p05270 [Chloropicon primus]
MRGGDGNQEEPPPFRAFCEPSPHASLIVSYKDDKMYLDAMYMAQRSGLVRDFVFEGTRDDLSALSLQASGEAEEEEESTSTSYRAAHMKLPEELFTAGRWKALVEVVSLLYSSTFCKAQDLAGLFNRFPLKLSMKDSLEGATFTWDPAGLSKVEAPGIKSPEFVAAGCKWRVAMHLKDKDSNADDRDRLSVFLELAENLATLPQCWSRFTCFELSLVNHKDPGMTKKYQGRQSFTITMGSWGFRTRVEIGDLFNPSKGYIVDDRVTIVARITRATRQTTAPLDVCTFDSLLDAGRFLRADTVTQLLDEAITIYLRDWAPLLLTDKCHRCSSTGCDNDNPQAYKRGVMNRPCAMDLRIRESSQSLMTALILADEYDLSGSWKCFLAQVKERRENNAAKLFIKELVLFFQDHGKTMNGDVSSELLVAVL